MKDFLGNELNIGDTVVMIQPRYRELVKATILRFTDHYVFLKYKLHYGDHMDEVKQTPDQLIKI